MIRLPLPNKAAQEHRSRRLFNYMMQAAINEDSMNRPGATSDNTLSAMLGNLREELKGLLKAGSKAPMGQGYDPVMVAAVAARIAAHAYAIARNNGVLNDVDLREIAERIDQ